MSGKLKQFSGTGFFPNLAIILAFCSMSYEFLLAKNISLLTGMPVVWQPVCIGTYLVGMGLGSFFYSKKENLFNKKFVNIELILATVGSVSIIILLFWHIVYRIYIFDAMKVISDFDIPSVYYFGIGSMLVVGIIGTLTGFELPILISLNKKQTKNTTAQILFWYQVGILAAVLFFYSVTVYSIELYVAALIVGTCNLIAALFIFIKLHNPQSKLKFHIAFLAISVVIFLSYPIGSEVLRFQLKNHYYNIHRFRGVESGAILSTKPHSLLDWKVIDDLYPDVERYTTEYQHIDLVSEFKADGLGQIYKTSNRVMFLDQHFQFSFQGEKDYHEHMAYVAMNIFGKKPEKILVLGAGDGLLVRELLASASFKTQIELVEIDKGMIEFSKENAEIRKLNNKSLFSKQVKIHFQDAFQYLRHHREQKYDAVYIDFPYPFTFDTAKLFSSEFLRLVRNVVSNTGFVVMDAPYNMDKGPLDSLNTYIGATVFYSGFDNLVAFKGRRETFLAFTLRNISMQFKMNSTLGIDYQVLDESYFSNPQNFRVIENQFYSDQMHSIFKTKHVFYPDPRF